MTDIDPKHIDAVGDVDCMPLRNCVGTLAAQRILDSPDPAVHAAMLDALTRHGVLTEEHGYIPVDETGAAWAMRSLDEALEVAKTSPVGDTYGDGAPRPGIVTIEHGMRYQSPWQIVGEVAP